jgi:hypothetical protein
MGRWLLWAMVFFIPVHVQAQVKGHDMLVLENNKGRKVKTYFKGQTIEMGVSGHEVFGVIRKIQDDSIFIQYYDIRRAYTMWGTQIMDTVSAFLIPFAVKDINWIRKPPGKFEFVRNGVILMIGGGAYIMLHIVNAAILKQPVIGSTVAIAGGIAAAGLVMNKLRKRKYEIGHDHTLKYISLE